MNSDLMKMLQANDQIQDVTGQPFFTEYDPETKQLSPSFPAPIIGWKIKKYSTKHCPAFLIYPAGEWLAITIEIAFDEPYYFGDGIAKFELLVDKAFDMDQIKHHWSCLWDNH